MISLKNEALNSQCNRVERLKNKTEVSFLCSLSIVKSSFCFSRGSVGMQCMYVRDAYRSACGCA